MDTDDDLLAAVERAFEQTGASAPRWPDPHPFGQQPRDEEYSRITDQSRYHRLLEARLDAWELVLRDAELARVERDGLVRRFVPDREGGLILLAETTIVDGAPFGIKVHVSDGTPHVLDRLPYCGCDACDDGSTYLLTELDGWVLTVLHGGVVRAERGGASITRRIAGWEGDADADPAWLDQDAAVLGVRRWAGAPWR